jgi:hypothetical protein
MNDDDDDDDGNSAIVIDRTGIKVTKRGQWMQDKVQAKKKKDYLKSYCCKYKDQRNILALEKSKKEFNHFF